MVLIITHRKLWSGGVPFSGADVFVALAAYSYILSKRQGDAQNPTQTKLSPLPQKLKVLLDSGRMNKDLLINKGISF